MSQMLQKPEKGCLLAAQPYLGDPHFEHSVIVLTEHNEEGTVGFVVNKALELTFDEVVIGFPKFSSKIYHGGPVQEDQLYFIHRKGDLIPGSIPIVGNLYWGGDIDPLKELIEMKLVGPSDVRFFLGYSGWTPGQLDEEIRNNSWLILEEGVLSILDDEPKDIWQKIMHMAGGDFALFANGPDDFTLN